MKKKGNLKIKILQYNVTIFRCEMKAEESKIGKKINFQFVVENRKALKF